jgi:capsular exopolysaccharide synthesis family protein
VNPKSPISEAYRSLRTNISFSSVDDAIRVVMVTSAKPGEGKTTTAVNLAVAYAQADKKVLILDADLRKPMMHQILNVSNRIGFTTLLANPCTIEQAVAATHISNLSLLTSGPIPPNPSEMLGSRRMAELLDELKTQFDIIIIDTPPALAVTDAQIVASRCDGVLLVVDAGKIKREHALKAKSNLERASARLLGVVLNNKNRKDVEAYYYDYYGAQDGHEKDITRLC